MPTIINHQSIIVLLPEKAAGGSVPVVDTAGTYYYTVVQYFSSRRAYNRHARKSQKTIKYENSSFFLSRCFRFSLYFSFIFRRSPQTLLSCDKQFPFLIIQSIDPFSFPRYTLFDSLTHSFIYFVIDDSFVHSFTPTSIIYLLHYETRPMHDSPLCGALPFKFKFKFKFDRNWNCCRHALPGGDHNCDGAVCVCLRLFRLLFLHGTLARSATRCFAIAFAFAIAFTFHFHFAFTITPLLFVQSDPAGNPGPRRTRRSGYRQHGHAPGSIGVEENDRGVVEDR